MIWKGFATWEGVNVVCTWSPKRTMRHAHAGSNRAHQSLLPSLPPMELINAVVHDINLLLYSFYIINIQQRSYKHAHSSVRWIQGDGKCLPRYTSHGCNYSYCLISHILNAILGTGRSFAGRQRMRTYITCNRFFFFWWIT